MAGLFSQPQHTSIIARVTKVARRKFVIQVEKSLRKSKP